MSGTRGDARKRLTPNPVEVAKAALLEEAADICKAAGYEVVKVDPRVGPEMRCGWDALVVERL